MNNHKLWITSFPHGKAIIVEVIEERKDKSGYFYIRKSSGRTDTTSSEFLFDLPKQITSIDMGTCGRTPKSVRSELCCLNAYKHCFMNPLPLYV